MENFFSPPVFVVFLLWMCLMMGHGGSDLAADRAECTEQLIGLSTCLSYINSDAAMSPTPDCCNGFKQVTTKSLKCLCILIKDRNNPELGIKLNVSRALTLPAKCDAPTRISTCTKILNLPPNSTDAKDFQQFEDTLEGKKSSANGSNVKANSTVSRGVLGGEASGGEGKRFMRLIEMFGGVLLLFSVLQTYI